MRFTAMGIVLACVVLQGCAALTQQPGTVIHRPPTESHLITVRDANGVAVEPKLALARHAALDYEYALMSDSAYFKSPEFPAGADQWVRLQKCGNLEKEGRLAIVNRENPRASDVEMLAPGGTQTLLASLGWKEWPPFLSDATWCAAVTEGLAFKVFQRDKPDSKPEVVISFRGTVFSYPSNWKANLIWATDTFNKKVNAYSVVREELTRELLAELRKRYPDEVLQADGLRIATTGHSLGGSLAQHLAYAFPPEVGMAESLPGLRVKEVTVFDPSPVNGWARVPVELASRNAGKLPVRRVYQHGEFLALVRLPLSYVYSAAPVLEECEKDPDRCEPYFSEVKYWVACEADPYFSQGNGFNGWNENMVTTHSIQLLACGLSTAAGRKPEPFICRNPGEIAPKRCSERLRE